MWLRLAILAGHESRAPTVMCRSSYVSGFLNDCYPTCFLVFPRSRNSNEIFRNRECCSWSLPKDDVHFGGHGARCEIRSRELVRHRG